MMLRAVPSCSNDTVRVCRICFTIDGRLYPMTAYKNLYKAYETLTGLLLEYEDNLPPYLCTECTRQLLNCAHFRTRSLRAHLILLEIIKKHDYITLESIQSVLGPQSLQGSHLTNNHSDEYDLDMKLVEELGPPSSCIDIPIDSIKVEIENVINPDTFNNKENDSATNLAILKYENNDNVINLDIVKYEDTTCDGVVETSSLHGDTVLNDVKEELTNVEELHGDPLAGGDYSSDNSRPLAEVALTAKLSATAVQQVAKPPGYLNQTKIASVLMDDKLSCDICHYVAVNVGRLKTHLKAHAATKSYSCAVCNYITIKKTLLTRHIKVHSGVKPYSCDVCDKTFSQRIHLQNHLRTHSCEKQPGVDCGLLMDDKISCDICHYKAVSVARLKSHLKAHAATKSYSCSVCKYITIKKTQLTRHIKVHSGVKPYSCDVCDKTFSQRTHLQNHLRTHSGEKPHTCDICDKSFSQRVHLQNHLRTHSGEKPYTCEVCNKSFSKRCSIKIHLRTHSGVKPYTCNFCQKSFSERGTLQKHLRTHSGQKPYTCNTCNKSFSESGSLQKHLRKHSGEN